MKYRLDKQGNKISVLGYGCMRFTQKAGKIDLPKAEKARKLFADFEIKRTPAEWAFRWLWNQPEVTCVLSGMNSMEMVRENVRNAVYVKNTVHSILKFERN